MEPIQKPITQPAGTNAELNQLDQDSVSTAFWKPEPGKLNRAMILAPFIRGMTDYKDATKKDKPQYTTIIVDPATPDNVLTWSVKAKNALKDLSTILHTRGLDLKTVVGGTIVVTVTKKPLGKTGGTYDEYTLIMEDDGVPIPQTWATISKRYPDSLLMERSPKYFEILGKA